MTKDATRYLGNAQAGENHRREGQGPRPRPLSHLERLQDRRHKPCDTRHVSPMRSDRLRDLDAPGDSAGAAVCGDVGSGPPRPVTGYRDVRWSPKCGVDEQPCRRPSSCSHLEPGVVRCRQRDRMSIHRGHDDDGNEFTPSEPAWSRCPLPRDRSSSLGAGGAVTRPSDTFPVLEFLGLYGRPRSSVRMVAYKHMFASALLGWTAIVGVVGCVARTVSLPPAVNDEGLFEEADLVVCGVVEVEEERPGWGLRFMVIQVTSVLKNRTAIRVAPDDRLSVRGPIARGRRRAVSMDVPLAFYLDLVKPIVDGFTAWRDISADIP